MAIFKLYILAEAFNQEHKQVHSDYSCGQLSLILSMNFTNDCHVLNFVDIELYYYQLKTHSLPLQYRKSWSYFVMFHLPIEGPRVGKTFCLKKRLLIISNFSMEKMILINISLKKNQLASKMIFEEGGSLLEFFLKTFDHICIQSTLCKEGLKRCQQILPIK